jgi:hypothetical protein
MRRLFPVLMLLTWALWFGGLVTVVIAVNAVAFAHPPSADRTIFDNAAPPIFHAFERYQLGLSVVASLTTLAAFAATRARIHLVVLGLFWAATIAALGSTLYNTREIDRMREANLTQTEEFKATHNRATWLYGSEAVALLLAGLIMPMTFEARPSSDRIIPEVSPAPGLRV